VPTYSSRALPWPNIVSRLSVTAGNHLPRVKYVITNLSLWLENEDHQLEELDVEVIPLDEEEQQDEQQEKPEETEEECFPVLGERLAQRLEA